MGIRRPAVIIFALFTAGIIASGSIKFSLLMAVVVLMALIILGLKFRRFPRTSSALILAAVFVLGALYAQSYRRTDPVVPLKFRLSSAIGDTVYAQGVIDSTIDRRKIFRTQKTSFALSVKYVKTMFGWRKVDGKVLVNLFSDGVYHYGDHLIVQGKLHYPFEFDKEGKFSYREYLSRKGIALIISAKKTSYVKVLGTGEGNRLYAGIMQLRQTCQSLLARYFSTPETGIMQAMLWGDTSEVPKTIEQLYIRTGTAHILAVSGFNVGIMATVIFLFLGLFPLGRKKQVILTIILLIVYAILAGARPPVVRATIMGIVFLLSYLIERETDGLSSLCVAGFILLVMNPLNIWDVGFQLSFLSVFFIIYFLPDWLKRVPELSWPMIDQAFRWLSQSLILSLTAWIGVAGLIAYYFEIVTPVSVAANLFVVPLSTALVVLGVGFMISAAIFPWLAGCFCLCIKFILNLMIYGIYIFDQMPGAHIFVKDISCWHVIVYYVFIAVLAGVSLLRRSRENSSDPAREQRDHFKSF